MYNIYVYCYSCCYSATTNMEILIKQHNKNVLHRRENSNTCLYNCRDKESCPLNDRCLEACIVDKAEDLTE